jgi:hypothetical protein
VKYIRKLCIVVKHLEMLKFRTDYPTDRGSHHKIQCIKRGIYIRLGILKPRQYIPSRSKKLSKTTEGCRRRPALSWVTVKRAILRCDSDLQLCTQKIAKQILSPPIPLETYSARLVPMWFRDLWTTMVVSDSRRKTKREICHWQCFVGP